MKNRSYGLGYLIYFEWLYPIRYYYRTLRINEIIFEVLFPIVVSVIADCLYFNIGLTDKALSSLAELLPTSISILIGFTIMMITLLLTCSGENVNKLKSEKTNRKIGKQQISLFQGLHIQFSHTLVSEVILLLIVFFYYFIRGLGISGWLGLCILGLEIYLVLNILLSILRGMVNIFFSFFKDEKTKE